MKKLKIVPVIVILILISSVMTFLILPKTMLSFDGFDIFPVSIEKLFGLNNETRHEEILNMTKSWGYMPISPFSRHWEIIHTEGGGKWYITPLEPLEVYLPADGFVKRVETRSGEIIKVNNKEFVMDVMIDFYLGNGVKLRLDHLAVYKPLYDKILGVFKFLKKGEFLGLSPAWKNSPVENTVSLDFQLFDDKVDNGIGDGPYKHVVCPLNYFTDELRNRILELYNGTYEALKEYGFRPESKICSPYNINIPHTIWGTWYYMNGPFEYDEDEIWRYTGGIISLVHESFANKETFHTYPNGSAIGTFDGIIAQLNELKKESVPVLGSWIIGILEGNNISGILEGIYPLYYGDYERVYIKYELKTSDNSLKEELKIEFFDSLEEAEHGFTNNAMIYTRDSGAF